MEQFLAGKNIEKQGGQANQRFMRGIACPPFILGLTKKFIKPQGDLHWLA